MIARAPDAEHVVLYDVSWPAYEKILRAFGDRRFPHTYINGTLEIMTISHEHEWLKSILGRFIETLSLELDVNMTSSGSGTLRRQLKRRGLEPDESYYIAHYAEVYQLKQIDLNLHPPPDLVVEIDVTRKSLGRMEPYARLGVPEIWVHDHSGIKFLERKSERAYGSIAQSLAFPAVASSDIQRFLDRKNELPELSLMKEFVAWVRKLAKQKD